MNFKFAHLKTIKADIVKREFRITFVVEINEETLRTCHELSLYADDESSDVELEITPRQLQLNFDMGKLKNFS